MRIRRGARARRRRGADCSRSGWRVRPPPADRPSPSATDDSRRANHPSRIQGAMLAVGWRRRWSRRRAAAVVLGASGRAGRTHGPAPACALRSAAVAHAWLAPVAEHHLHHSIDSRCRRRPRGSGGRCRPSRRSRLQWRRSWALSADRQKHDEKRDDSKTAPSTHDASHYCPLG